MKDVKSSNSFYLLTYLLTKNNQEKKKRVFLLAENATDTVRMSRLYRQQIICFLFHDIDI